MRRLQEVEAGRQCSEDLVWQVLWEAAQVRACPSSLHA